MQNGIAPLLLWNSFIENNRSRAPLIRKRLSEAPRLLKTTVPGCWGSFLCEQVNYFFIVFDITIIVLQI